MDRESRDPFDMLDEIEKTLALDTTPMNWPVGRGRIHRHDRGGTGRRPSARRRRRQGRHPARYDDPGGGGAEPNLDASAIEDEFELVREACKGFDLAAFREGHLSPVFFGSALKNFGVGDLLDALGRIAPPPRDQKADKRVVEAYEPRMSAFVFKIQANMDPNHLDRIAFARLCSGKLTRGMKVKQIRTGKQIALNAPLLFAKDRAVADVAMPATWSAFQPRLGAHRRHPDRG